MHPTIPGTNQLQTIFGGGYVPEHHADQTHRYLPPSGNGEIDMDFGEILKTLRKALGLR